jgi:phycocyanin-associated rod protein
MNETMRLVQRMGGKITGVTVNGGDLVGAATKAAPARKKSQSKPEA